MKENMKHYIITYHYPESYRGTYLIQGKDGIDAGNKLQNFLKETKGDTKDSYCVVHEVVGSQIQIIG